MLESSLAAKAKNSRHALRERLAAQRWKTHLYTSLGFSVNPRCSTINNRRRVRRFASRNRYREVAVWWMSITANIYALLSAAVRAKQLNKTSFKPPGKLTAHRLSCIEGTKPTRPILQSLTGHLRLNGFTSAYTYRAVMHRSVQLQLSVPVL